MPSNSTFLKSLQLLAQSLCPNCDEGVIYTEEHYGDQDVHINQSPCSWCADFEGLMATLHMVGTATKPLPDYGRVDWQLRHIRTILHHIKTVQAK